MRWQYLPLIFASIATTKAVGQLKQEVKSSTPLSYFHSRFLRLSSPLPSYLSSIHLTLVTALERTTQGIPESPTFVTILVSAQRVFRKHFPFSVSCPTTTALVVRLPESSSDAGLTRMDTMFTHHRADSS